MLWSKYYLVFENSLNIFSFFEEYFFWFLKMYREFSGEKFFASAHFSFSAEKFSMQKKCIIISRFFSVFRPRNESRHRCNFECEKKCAEASWFREFSRNIPSIIHYNQADPTMDLWYSIFIFIFIFIHILLLVVF